MQIFDVVDYLTIPIYVMSIYFLFTSFVYKVKNKRDEIIAYTIFGILQIVVLLLTTIPIIKLIFSIGAFIILSFNYDMNMKKRIIIVTYVIMIILAIEMLLTLIVISNDIDLFNNYTVEFGGFIVFERVSMLIVAYFINRIKRKNDGTDNLPIYHYFYKLLTLIGVLFLYLTSVNKNELSDFEILFNSFTMISVVVLFITYDKKMQDFMELYIQSKIIKEQNLSYEKQNEIRKDYEVNIRNTKHDIKNHLIALKSLNQNNNTEIDDYIDSMLNKIELDNNYVNSGNFVVDSLINFKMQKLYDTKVNTHIKVNIPTEINISPYDLTVILGNLLENAIDAVLKCKDEKKLSIIINYDKGNYTIMIDNTYFGKIITNGDRYKTTKKDKNLHGLGIESVKKTLEKYNTNLVLNHTDNMFSAFVSIPNTEKI